MTLKAAIQQKWDDTPVTLEQAKAVLARPACSACLACGSKLVLPISRPPIDAYRAHCNHCGSEIPIAVMLNREAWQVTAAHDWQNTNAQPTAGAPGGKHSL
jgi:hypothetical protein